MKSLKTILPVLLAAMFLLTAAGCGETKTDRAEESPKETAEVTETEEPAETPTEDSDREAAGTYTGIYTKFVGDDDSAKVTDEEFSLILLEDGTGEHFRDGNTYKVTWEQHGEEVTMTETFMGVTIDYNGTLKDGQLNLFNGDKDDPFTYEYVYESEA